MSARIVILSEDELRDIISNTVHRAISSYELNQYPEWITASQAMDVLKRRSRSTLKALHRQHSPRTTVKNNRLYYFLPDIKKISELIN